MADERENINIEEEDDGPYTLVDEDGNEVDFEILDKVDYEGDCYFVMVPVEDEDSGVVIMKLELGETEDDDSLVTVVDEILLDNVYGIFKENNKDVYDFEEE